MDEKPSVFIRGSASGLRSICQAKPMNARAGRMTPPAAGPRCRWQHRVRWPTPGTTPAGLPPLPKAAPASASMHHRNWSAALYLDSRASAEQSDALVKIFSGQAGDAPAALHPVLGIKSAVIAYNANVRTRHMTIRDVVESEIDALRGADGADVTISNRSESSPAIRAASRARRCSSFTIDLTGRTGQFSPSPMKVETCGLMPSLALSVR
jgi:hypothetical protein